MNKTIEDGVYAAALTPLYADLHCNDQELAEHCLDLIARGCKGIVLFGTTGEGPSFSIEEKKHSIKQVISKGLDPQKIIIANGSASLQDTIDLGKDLNCLAYLIAPPSFFKNLSEEGILSYYREVLKHIHSLPVLLYHIPQFTGVPLTVNIVKTLCEEFPNVIGLKESEGNLSLTKAILKEVPQCKVFVGFEKQIPEAMKAGAAGSICGMANLWPELICSLYEKKKLSPEFEKKLSAIEKYPFIACFKAILGWDLLRPPLVPLSPEEKLRLLDSLN